LANNAGGRFAINATTGAITVANGALLDYQSATSHVISVRATDNSGLIFERAFTITVNANHAPTGATLTNSSIAENAANGTFIGTVAGVDSDAGPGTGLGYSLTDNAGGRFAINATTGAITVANGALLNYEAATSHAITVRTTDQGGLTFDKAFTIALTNVNEAPTNATLSGGSVVERSATGTVVGTVTGVDPDAGATMTYSLTNNAGGRFSIMSNGVLKTAVGGTSLTAGTYAITVRTTDQGGLTFDKSLNVTVTPQTVTVQNADGTTTTTSYDSQNLYSWTSFRTDKNAQGNAFYQLGIRDVGGKWENEYDPTGAYTWSNRITAYNTANQVISKTTNNDDGTHMLFANDLSNTYSFANFTIQYDANWNVMSVTGTNDNGTTNINTDEVWTSFDTLVWYTSPYVVSLPVILDLDGNGIDVTPVQSSTAFFNMDNLPGREHTAWVGRNDGLLAIDLGKGGSGEPDGVIDQTKEIVFTEWAPGAMSDMDALRQVFDSNHNGTLDAGDDRWSAFRVWQDADGDGISQRGELKTLDQLGISSIDLSPVGPGVTLDDGSVIQGLSKYTRTDGTTGVAGDVALAHEDTTRDDLLAMLRSETQRSALGSGEMTPQQSSDNACGGGDGLSQLIQAMATHSTGCGSLESSALTSEPYVGPQAMLTSSALHP
jgi:hypothetical protein